jgi:hypothetical protein
LTASSSEKEKEKEKEIEREIKGRVGCTNTAEGSK